MASIRKKILLLTCSEHGQANIFLAVSHALLQTTSPPELHLGSFEYLAPLVSQCSQQALKTAPDGATEIIFHVLPEPSFEYAIYQPEINMEALSKPPGIWNTTNALITMSKCCCPWTPDQFTAIFKAIVAVVESVNPDLIVLDTVLGPGMAAIKHLGRRHVMLIPNMIKDWSVSIWKSLFKFPCIASGLPYPLPMTYWPKNIYFVLLLIALMVSNSRGKAAARRLKQETGADLVLMGDIPIRRPPNLKMLVAGLPELDFAEVRAPQQMLPIGPMLRPAPPVNEVDPELSRWLEKGQTVFVNLGTHQSSCEDAAVEMAKGLRVLLQRADRDRVTEAWDLQVLWKLKREAEYEPSSPGCRIHQVLASWLDADRVRIVEWVKPEPLAILKTGKVVCTVNHGGANSWLEGVSVGIPQVILPQWFDTFDFAYRSEYLGIGRCGSAKAMPGWAAQELGDALSEVIIGDGAEGMRVKARKLADVCGKEEGRDIAARAILQLMNDKDYLGIW